VNAVQQLDAQVAGQEELLEHCRLLQKRESPSCGQPAEQQVAAERPAAMPQYASGDLGLLVEGLHRRLREEVAEVINKHQSQYAELRELITTVFAQQKAALSADGLLDGLLKAGIQRVVKEQVADALSRPASFGSKACTCCHAADIGDDFRASGSTLPSPRATTTDLAAYAMTPPAGGAKLVADPCLRTIVPSLLFKAPTVGRPAGDAIGSPLATPRGFASPMATPQSCRRPVPATSASDGALQTTAHPTPDMSCPSPRLVASPNTSVTTVLRAGVPVPVHPVAPSATGSCVFSQGVGASTPRCPSGSRNASRSWPSSASTQRPGTAPTTAVAPATPAGTGLIVSAAVGRMASYAQRRRLATSRGALTPPMPAGASIAATPVPQTLYTARSRGLVAIRQPCGAAECRPKSQDQRSFRLRTAR